MGYFCNYKSTVCFIWLRSASFSPITSLCPPQPAEVPGPWTPGSFCLARGAGVPPALLPSLQPLSPRGLLAFPPTETKSGAGAGRVSIHPAAQCQWGRLGLGAQGRRCRLPRGLVVGGSERLLGTWVSVAPCTNCAQWVLPMACVMCAAGCRGLADTERLGRRFLLVNDHLPHRSICTATSWPLFLSNPPLWAAECSGGAPSRLRLLCPGSVLSPFCLGHF